MSLSRMSLLSGIAVLGLAVLPVAAHAEDAPAVGIEKPATSAEAREARKEARAEKMKEKMDENFAEADADKDGFLSLEEFLERPKKKFAEIDGDKDGKLTKEEMKAHSESHRAKWKGPGKHGKDGQPGEAPAEPAPAPAE